MTPLHPKGLINPSLDARFPNGPKRIDGLPSSHPNLDDGHLCLLKNFPKGVLVVEVLPAPLRQEEVENEAMENVKRLSTVKKTPDMVSLDTKGVVFSFEHKAR
jgi:hypothetical protein